MKLVSIINHKEKRYYGPLIFEHDGVPTYKECRQLIREFAHGLQERSGGSHDDGIKWWLMAEKILFDEQKNYFTHGGYCIFVRDRRKPLIDGMYHHFEAGIVAPSGYFPIRD